MSKPRLKRCDRCGGEFGEWDYRKVRHRLSPICKACEAEKKAASMRKKQEDSAANHLLILEAKERTNHGWEEAATARVID